ncbi:MAG: ribosome maturation factor RimM [bacterium]
MQNEKWIPLGVVGRPFGIKGEIKLKPYNPDTTWFDHAEGVWVRENEVSEPTFYPLVRSRRHKEFILLTLKGIHGRDEAERLKGSEAVVPEDKLEPLSEDEYYWYHLIGLRVEDTEGRHIGEVVRMEPTAPSAGGNDLFVVRGDKGEILIPASDPPVKDISQEQGRMLIEPDYYTGPG